MFLVVFDFLFEVMLVGIVEEVVDFVVIMIGDWVLFIGLELCWFNVFECLCIGVGGGGMFCVGVDDICFGVGVGWVLLDLGVVLLMVLFDLGGLGGVVIEVFVGIEWFGIFVVCGFVGSVGGVFFVSCGVSVFLLGFL